MDIVYLGIALAMDAFALSVGLGTIYKQNDYTKFALKGALIFGFCQGFFFFLGTIIGSIIKMYLLNLLKYISFGLLFLVSLKMFLEFFKNDEVNQEIETKNLLYIGVLTSIDALASGVAAISFDHNSMVMASVIAIITFVLCLVAFALAKKLSKLKWVEEYSLFLSSVILFILAIKLVM